MSNEALTSEESLAANGKSFHWARRFLGAEMGNSAARLYAFCRVLDDMADGDIEDGPRRLAVIRSQLDTSNTPSIQGSDPALAGFGPLMAEKNFSPDVLIALIDGLLDDQREEVALQSEADLLRYAYRVAGTVGLLMCDVLACHDEQARVYAIDLGIAMQLTNIARDVLEDAVMNRRYIPADWVDGARPADIKLAAGAPSSAACQQITDAVGQLLDLAEKFYDSGARGYCFLPFRAHVSIAVAARVYRQIGVQLRASGLAWYSGRQVTSKITKLRCSVRAMGSLKSRITARPEGEHDAALHISLRGLPYVR